jgi:O-antigen ligase
MRSGSRMLKFDRLRTDVVAADSLVMCAIGLTVAMLLGGGSRQGALADGWLQLLCCPLLAVGLAQLVRTGVPQHLRGAMVLICAIILVPLLQLVPLPAALTQQGPLRGIANEIEALAGLTVSWRPISVAPDATRLAALSLIPPLTVFVCCLRTTYRQRRGLSLILVAGAVVSALLGLLQVAQGPNSPLRFEAYGASTDAVGGFDNRNHLAALLYVGWLLAVSWLLVIAQRVMQTRSKSKRRGSDLLWLVVLIVVVAVLMAATLATRSRAGIALMGIAVVISLAWGGLGGADADETLNHSAVNRWLSPRRLIALVFLVILALSMQFALLRFVERLGGDLLVDTRLVIARTTLEAASAVLPWGAGTGTFTKVYGFFERPQEALLNTYINRAHNDFLEVWLEAGVIGAVVMALGVVWILLQGWRLRAGIGQTHVDRAIAWSSFISLLLLMIHSVLDYPLRTSALATVFAMCAALICKPVAAVNGGAEAARTGGTRTGKSGKARAPQETDAVSAAPPPGVKVVRPHEPWGGGTVQWPEDWNKPRKKT